MSKSSAAVFLAVAACLLAVWAVSCRHSSPTSPGYGGGGGAGAPELNGNVAPNGGTYAHTFNTPGKFNYHCTIHASCSSLAGTIVVVPVGTAILRRTLSITQSGGTSGVYGTTCSSLSVSSDSVQVGDTVTWTNSSPFAHNVISD